MKKCSGCGVTKSLDDFHNRASSKDGKQSQCKPCRIEKVKQWQTENAEKYKAYYTRYQKESRTLRLRKATKYGLTLEELDSMIEESKGLCEICKKEPRVSLVIDHCHKTTKVRGLICEKCNQALGLFNDNIESLKSAIAYLQK